MEDGLPELVLIKGADLGCAAHISNSLPSFLTTIFIKWIIERAIRGADFRSQFSDLCPRVLGFINSNVFPSDFRRTRPNP
jgi:hypothetical protein